MRKQKVEGNSDLIRDNQTNVILNTNKTNYDQYISMRSEKKKSNQKVDSIEQEVAEIKDEIGEIKMLLKELLKSS